MTTPTIIEEKLKEFVSLFRNRELLGGETDDFWVDYTSDKEGNEIPDWLRAALTSIYEQGVADDRRKRLANIGMLRQWLNEDRISDASRFVTNEDILHWLN